MCGIVGLVNFSQSATLLPQALNQIVHRGPDACGEFYSDDRVIALGHRRLSIIDIGTSANQPFIKDRFVLVFNGEIYNYQLLRDELSKLGAQFVTHSDTEVLLEAWRYWGADALNKLRGMFAFALFDKQTYRLILARDPFGIKPLFIYRQGKQLAFASELKALRAILPNLKLDHKALVASLLYVWVPESTCVYQDIKKFPPGHYVEVELNSGYQIKKYYDFSILQKPAQTGITSVAQLQTIIEDSVTQHLVADVPVSTLLSGGLDSSLITAIAAQHLDHLDSYTIAFQSRDKRFEAMPDDAKYAKQLANKLGVHLHEIEITPNVVEMLPQMVSILDEPIGDAAAINTYLICQAAHKAGVKVLLSGMGADEFFAGYRKHYACLLASRYRALVPKFIRENVIAPMVNHLPVAGKNRGFRLTRWAQRFVQFANLDEEAAFRRSYTYYSENELYALLQPELRSCVDELVEEHAIIYQQAKAHDQVNRMCYTDTQLFMLGLNITYSDRASMAASTELRVPFIDKEVAKAAFAIAGQQKIAGKVGKAILKKAAEKWLPHDIIYRPKAGFGAPLRSWIRNDLREMVDDYLLSTSGLASRGLLHGEQIQKMIADDRAGKADYAQRIWQLLTLEQWFRNQKS